MVHGVFSIWQQSQRQSCWVPGPFIRLFLLQKRADRVIGSISLGGLCTDIIQTYSSGGYRRCCVHPPLVSSFYKFLKRILLWSTVFYDVKSSIPWTKMLKPNQRATWPIYLLMATTIAPSSLRFHVAHQKRRVPLWPGHRTQWTAATEATVSPDAPLLRCSFFVGGGILVMTSLRLSSWHWDGRGWSWRNFKTEKFQKQHSFVWK